MKVSGKLIVLLGEGEVVPFWYGLAYKDFTRDVCVFLPIPINFIIRASREFYWLMMKAWPNKLERKIHEETHAAFERGKQMGREHERNKIYDSLTEVLQKDFNAIWNKVADNAIAQERIDLINEIRGLQRKQSTHEAPHLEK